MFWRHGEASAPPPSDLGDPNVSQPIDPAVEEKRVAQLTGGRTIVIERRSEKGVKLPGL